MCECGYPVLRAERFERWRLAFVRIANDPILSLKPQRAWSLLRRVDAWSVSLLCHLAQPVETRECHVGTLIEGEAFRALYPGLGLVALMLSHLAVSVHHLDCGSCLWPQPQKARGLYLSECCTCAVLVEEANCEALPPRYRSAKCWLYWHSVIR